MKSMLFCLFLMMSFEALAHEGHQTPGQIPARHGGVGKAAHDLYVELVAKNQEIKIYFLDHDEKAIALSDVVISADVLPPRAKKKEPLVFRAVNSQDPAQAHYLANYDAKGAHRYELQLSVKYRGKKDLLKYQVEPRK